MKRALTICSVFCALMISVAAVNAQKGANFAGAWELDKAKSQLPQRQSDNIKSATWTVTQDDKQLTNEQKIERVEGAGGGGGGGGRGGRRRWRARRRMRDGRRHVDRQARRRRNNH